MEGAVSEAFDDRQLFRSTDEYVCIIFFSAGSLLAFYGLDTVVEVLLCTLVNRDVGDSCRKVCCLGNLLALCEELEAHKLLNYKGINLVSNLRLVDITAVDTFYSVPCEGNRVSCRRSNVEVRNITELVATDEYRLLLRLQTVAEGSVRTYYPVGICLAVLYVSVLPCLVRTERCVGDGVNQYTVAIDLSINRISQ